MEPIYPYQEIVKNLNRTYLIGNNEHVELCDFLHPEYGNAMQLGGDGKILHRGFSIHQDDFKSASDSDITDLLVSIISQPLDGVILTHLLSKRTEVYNQIGFIVRNNKIICRSIPSEGDKGPQVLISGLEYNPLRIMKDVFADGENFYENQIYVFIRSKDGKIKGRTTVFKHRSRYYFITSDERTGDEPPKHERLYNPGLCIMEKVKQPSTRLKKRFIPRFDPTTYRIPDPVHIVETTEETLIIYRDSFTIAISNKLNMTEVARVAFGGSTASHWDDNDKFMGVLSPDTQHTIIRARLENVAIAKVYRGYELILTTKRLETSSLKAWRVKSIYTVSKTQDDFEFTPVKMDQTVLKLEYKNSLNMFNLFLSDVGHVPINYIVSTWIYNKAKQLYGSSGVLDGKYQFINEFIMEESKYIMDSDAFRYIVKKPGEEGFMKGKANFYQPDMRRMDMVEEKFELDPYQVISKYLGGNLGDDYSLKDRLYFDIFGIVVDLKTLLNYKI